MGKERKDKEQPCKP